MNAVWALSKDAPRRLLLTASGFSSRQDTSLRALMAAIVKLTQFCTALIARFAKVETGDPDPVKALAYVKRYAELQPVQPKPRDSIGEVSRISALDQDRSYTTLVAQNNATSYLAIRRGDIILDGRFCHAGGVISQSAQMATTPRSSPVDYQQALLLFWAGEKAEGLQQLSVREAKPTLHSPMPSFEIQSPRSRSCPLRKTLQSCAKARQLI